MFCGILFISCRKNRLAADLIENYKWKIAHTYTFHYSEQLLSCVPHNATNEPDYIEGKMTFFCNELMNLLGTSLNELG